LAIAATGQTAAIQQTCSVKAAGPRIAGTRITSDSASAGHRRTASAAERQQRHGQKEKRGTHGQIPFRYWV
jgi:hypothetical protein